MANLRKAKKELREALQSEDWQCGLDAIAAGGKANIGALFSFLLLEPELMHRAAKALGLTVARLYETEPEAARDIIRRFMWHMNEESGNLGWGIPAAFAETLVASRPLADAYGKILNSYIMDLGFDDNYCDQDILRRTCYWAIGRLAQERPDLVEKNRPWLVKGLEDQDVICRGNAAWALAQLGADEQDYPALAKLAGAELKDMCEIFEDNQLKRYAVSDLAKDAMKKSARA